MIGQTLGNRYDIISKLGEGGMAETFEAEDVLLHRRVAVKVLRGELAKDAAFCDRFQREARAAANLSHPHIVAVYDIGQDVNAFYIVMELVRGADLKERIQTEGPLEEREALRLGAQVCQALQCAHDAGIVHRDIKPHNILVSDDGNVKVLDFGIAKAFSSEEASHTQALVGTAHYMSPEQALGEAVAPRSDLYSLGVVLYEAMTGRVPFTGETPVAIALKHAQSDPVRPSELRPELSSAAERVILRAMNKEPHRRFSSAREMGQALSDAAEGRAVAPTEPAVLPASDRTVVQPPPRLEQTMVRPAEPVVRVPARPPQAPAPERSFASNVLQWVAALVLVVTVVAAVVFYRGLVQRPRTVPVPNVVGRTEEEAKAELVASGLRVGSISEKPNDSVGAGQVASQSPGAGTEAALDSAVNLVVSSGRKVELARVPDVTQMAAEKATRMLTDAGLAVGTKTQEFSDSVPAGYVARQAPRAGSEVAKQTAIDLVISKGPEQPKPPPGGTPGATPPPGESVKTEGTVEYTVPEGSPGGPETVPVKIIARDRNGDRTVYEADHAPGDHISQKVEGVGEVAARIFVADHLEDEQTFSPPTQ